MWYHHTLRFTRRTRGINHISQAIRMCQINGLFCWSQFLIHEDDFFSFECGTILWLAFLLLTLVDVMRCQQYFGTAVFHHVEQTFRRILIIHGNIGSTSLHDTQQWRDEFFLSGQHDADESVGLYTFGNQACCQRVRLEMQLTIGNRACLVDNGNCIRGCLCEMTYHVNESLTLVIWQIFTLREFQDTCLFFLARQRDITQFLYAIESLHGKSLHRIGQ